MYKRLDKGTQGKIHLHKCKMTKKTAEANVALENITTSLSLLR